MRVLWTDLLAEVLLVAIGLPYVDYLLDGGLSLVRDAREMSAVGVVLALAAFVLMEAGRAPGRSGRWQVVLPVLVVCFGVVTFALARTAEAEVLLALFMAAIVVAWLARLVDRTGTALVALAPDERR